MPLHLVPHPLVHDALATLRDASTPPELFRRMAVRISLLLAAEATHDVPARDVAVTSGYVASEPCAWSGRRATLVP